MKEVWKGIADYPMYQISNMGNVRSLFVNRIMKSGNNGKGYRFIPLHNERGVRNHYIHRLVASAFLGECPEGKEVNHKDENKANNRLDNLEYVSKSENVSYGTAIKRAIETRRKSIITKRVIGFFADGTAIVFSSAIEAAMKIGFPNSKADIVKCCLHYPKYFTCRGIRWEYAG